MKRGAIFAAVVLVVAIILCLPVFAADKYVDPTVTVSAEKNVSKITVKASFDKDFETEHAGADLYLFAIRPYQSASRIDEYSPEISVKVTKDVEVTIPMDDNGDLLYCKFLLALKSTSGEYTSVTVAKYIENPEILASVKYDYPEKLSKKGLQVQMPADAQLLGVAHTTVNVEASEFIIGSSKPSGSVVAVEYKMGNKSVYFNAAKVEALDARVKELTEAGVNVFLQVINNPYNSEKMSQEVASMYFVGASTEASMYAVSTKDSDSVLYIRALFEFLAERYTREDKLYGFAGSFIVGYEVNSNRMYNNAGRMDMTMYLYSYTALLRIADTAMRSHYSNGRVYVPLSNRWTAKEGDDLLLDYPGYDFITTLNSIIKQGGDIPWNLSLNTYASSVTTISSIWNDPGATDSIDTTYMTMKNIDVACKYMGEVDMRYSGKIRDMIIGEFGISADPGSENELANQAVSYAYAYYKAVEHDEISAIIYHRHVDSSIEPDLYFGLWTTRPDTILTPLVQKPIYTVFKDIDVTPASEMSSSALNLIGANIWTSVVPGVTESVNPRQVIKAGAMAEDDIPDKKFDLKYTFKGSDLSGFTAGENAADVYSLAVLKEQATKVADLLGKKLSTKEDPYVDILEVVLDNSSYVDYMGTGKALEADLFKNAKEGYIKLTGKAELAGAADDETVSLMVRFTYTIPKDTVNVSKETMNRADGQQIVYEGTAEIKANDWTNVTFDISEYLKLTGGNAGSMKVWILPKETTTPEVRNCALMIAGIAVLAIKGTPVIVTILKVLGIIILIAAILLVLGFIALVIRARIMKERRRKAHAARRAGGAGNANRQGTGVPRNGLPPNPSRRLNSGQNQLPAKRPQNPQQRSGNPQNNNSQTQNPTRKRPPDNRQ